MVENQTAIRILRVPDTLLSEEAITHVAINWQRAPFLILALRENSTKRAFYAAFLDLLKFDELEVRQRRAFGLEQQVTDILITAATVDQHPNVPVEGLDHSEANLRRRASGVSVTSAILVERDAIRKCSLTLRTRSYHNTLA